MSEVIKLFDPEQARFNTGSRLYREGIELEKGVVITPEFLDRTEELLLSSFQIWASYPDIFLDMITPEASNFKLFPYQRLFLRACMRYTSIYITAARATSKTFLSILAKYLQCIFLPNHVGSIVAPNKSQAAKISKQKIEEIWRIWPLLEKEVEKSNFGKDYVDIFFKNGARLSIVGALDSDRGLRTHATLIDEARDQDGDMIQEVVLPQMNVSRRMSNGLVNPHEKINTQVIYATSAGTKSSFAYEALIGNFIEAIIDPRYAFCIGLDYRIPAQHGLIDSNYVKKLKLSPSYNEQTFAAEYLGTWLGGGEDSWFQFDKLTKYRKIKNPEWRQKYKEDKNVFYLISVDVGRLHDQTIATIFRVNIKNNIYYATLVNLFVLGRQANTKTFTQQAIDIKRLIETYKPKEVVIDTNGLGIGLADEMIKEQIDELGNVYPAYGFFNNDDYRKIQPRDAINILYSLKANGPLNSQIHSNAYSRINTGKVRFLIPEQEARLALMNTEMGKKMNTVERIERLMPHELTTKLFEEMSNLRLKKTGLDIVLEQINPRFPKDKYSSFTYGLWRIKEIEEEAFKKASKRSNGVVRKLIFYTGG